MSVDELYKLVIMIGNKVQKGNFKPENFNLAMLAVNLQMFKGEYGLPEDYQPGRPIPKIAYSLTQKIEDDLSPFKRLVSIVLDNDGHALYPADYVHLSTARCRYVLAKDNKAQNAAGKAPLKTVEVKIVDDQGYMEALTSEVVPATQEFPVLAFYDTYMQVAPTNMYSIELTYLAYPRTPVWAFTIVNNRPVYDAANSVQIEWKPIKHIDFAMRVCSYLGINIREPELIQYVETMKQKGE